MQQLFPDEATKLSGKILLEFPVPHDELLSYHSDDTAAHPTADTRKRSRPDGETASVIVPHLTSQERHALARFIKYGDQPATASECFRRVANSSVAPPTANTTTNAAASSRATAPQPHQWCFTALRQAMALLCRVVRLDTSAHYLNDTSIASTSATQAHSGITLIEWYCRYQALELELEDAVLRADALAATDGVPEATRQQTTADVAATVRTVASAVDALETTLIAMVLRWETSAAVDGGVDRAGVALEYVAAMLRGLPDVLQAEKWPTRVLCNRGSEQPATAQPTVASSQSSTALTAALLSDSPDSSGLLTATAAAKLRAQIGGATTSIAIQSLLLIRRADTRNVLGVATASPISRLAALDKLKGASRAGGAVPWTSAAGGASSASPQRPALELEQIDFREVMVRAWNRGYDLLGLQRLRFEMRALFYHLASPTATGDSSAASSSAAVPARVDVEALWRQWEAALSTHYKSFMQKVIVDGTPHDEEAMLAGDDVEVDACALMRRHAVADDALAGVQLIALRVVTKLQAVDAKGWFAVPAFDLVNVDFTSVRYWVQSPAFAHKSRREAFRSLCRVLERMVDRCVQTYGPTHAFSDVITNVRQQLVDVARGEGLL